ncbi:MAG TPA: hypothetical protein VFC28_02045, partial [Opitutaceae bacterium]|nr:hypothetical protein [Opitutaceae bacterium]
MRAGRCAPVAGRRVNVLTCFGLACLYAHMMRSVLAALPFYDEMWKLDVITAPSILERIQTLPTPLA